MIAHEGGDAIGNAAHLRPVPYFLVADQPLLGLELPDGRRNPDEARIAVGGKARKDTEAGTGGDQVADTVDVVAAHADAVAVMSHQPAGRGDVGRFAGHPDKVPRLYAVDQLSPGVDGMRHRADPSPGEIGLGGPLRADAEIGGATPDVDLFISRRQLDPDAVLDVPKLGDLL